MIQRRRAAHEPDASPGEWALTRRAFLGASAGTLTAAAFPARAGALSIQATSDLAIIRLGSVEAWRIDPSRFSGRPRLSVSESARRIHIQLQNARYPGTNVPAELDCDCRWSFRGWRMHLSLGSFDATGNFESWLAREETLSAVVPIAGLLLRDRHGDITLQPSSTHRVSFAPTWRLRFEDGPMQLGIFGAEQRCNAVDVGLCDPNATSLLERPDATRSAIRIERGAEEWQILPRSRPHAHGTLFTSSSIFDTVEIESSESRAGHIRVALSARASGEGALSFHPGSAFTTPDGAPLALALRDADYAIVATDAGTETALLAGLPSAPQWLRTADATLQIGDTDHAPAFQWTEDARDSSLQFAPRLLASLIPIEGVLTEAVPPPMPMQIALAGPPPDGAASVVPCGTGGAVEVCLPNCCVAVTRPKDLLALCFEFRNLRLRKHPFRKATLERCNTEDAYVIVHFPPQHIAEEALPEDTTSAPPGDVRPVASRAARPSRLAFRLKPGVNEIDYTLDSLLNWQQFDAALVALERHWRHIKEPEATETSIEFPYRIKLSPEEAAHWIHSAKAVEHDGRVELWHTRLAVNGPNVPRVAAVWSPDYVPGGPRPGPNDPFVLSVSNRDRHDIVEANHDSASCPEPIPAPLLMLSSLGAWSDLKGEWKEQSGRCLSNSLEKWEHVATMGRDQHVIVANRGFLYPFGHRAVLIRETERRVHPVAGTDGSVSFIAYLRKRLFIELREPVKNYAADPLLSFVQVTFLDRRSPLLDIAVVNNVVFPVGGVERCPNGVGSFNDEVFWPTVQQKPYRFRLRAFDKAGNTISFDAPVIFVENNPGAGTLPAYREAASCAYQKPENLPRRTSLLDGQKVGLAASFQKGDTEVDALNVVFIGDDQAAEEPSGFKPHIDTVSARIPALDQFVPGGGGSTTLRLRDPEKTTAQLFAEVMGTKPAASFSSSSDRSGGVAAPSINVTHLSRRFGPVGVGAPDPVAALDATSDAVDSFKAKDFFGAGANILGQIPLTAIVPDMPASSLDAVPGIRSLLTDWRDGPPQLTQSIAWTTSLTPFDAGPFRFEPRGQLVLAGKFEAFLGTTIKPVFEMTGTLNDFSIVLDFGVGVALLFDRLVFRVSSDGSTDVDPQIRDVEFLGALKFIQDLAKKFTQPAGFNISLLPGAVKVQAPPINLGKLSVGAFAFENLSITTWCVLPFTESPVEFGFAVARPDKPFLVTVGVYSGGGHFALTLDSKGDGVRYLRAGIEFGAQKEISFGSVAHGRLYVFGGLYYEQAGVQMTFRAYVRAGGEIEALGLISMGIELYLGLEYVAPGDLFGTARMTYSFSIGFVKKSFSISYQQRFAGSGSSTKSARLERARVGAPIALGITAQVVGDAPQPNHDEGRRIRITDTLDEGRWLAYWDAFAT